MQAVNPDKTSDSRYRCECNNTVINSIGITASAAGAYYYMPELKTALTSLSQYLIVSDPSTMLVAPLGLAGTLCYFSALAAVAAHALHSCIVAANDLLDSVEKTNSFSLVHLLILIRNLAMMVTILLGIVTADFFRAYALSQSAA